MKEELVAGLVVAGLFAIVMAAWVLIEWRQNRKWLKMPLIVMGGKTYLRLDNGTQRLLFDHLATEAELKSLKVMGRRVFEENLDARIKEIEGAK